MRNILLLFVYVCYLVNECNSMNFRLPDSYGTIFNYIDESDSLSNAVSKLTTSSVCGSIYHRTKYPTRELLTRVVMRSIMPDEAKGYIKKFKLQELAKDTLSINFREKWMFVAIMLRSKMIDPEDNLLCLVNVNGLIATNDDKRRLLEKSYGNWNAAVKAIKKLKADQIAVFDEDVQSYLMNMQEIKNDDNEDDDDDFCTIL